MFLHAKFSKAIGKNQWLFFMFLVIMPLQIPAQELRKFMCFAGVGNSSSNTQYAPPGHSKSPNIFPVHSFEPSLWVKKNDILLGFRIETFERQWIEKCTSLTFNLQYQLTKNPSEISVDKIKVMIGLGLGNYRGSNETLVYNNAVVAGVPGGLYTFVKGVNVNRVGLYPRITFLYKHVCVIIDYNLIRTEHLENDYIFFSSSNPGGQIWTSSYSRSESYLDLKIGYCFYRRKKIHLVD